MNTLVKIGAIGFGLFAFSELCGIAGEAQVLSSLIDSGYLDGKEIYDVLANNSLEGYAKFKMEAIINVSKLLSKYYGY